MEILELLHQPAPAAAHDLIGWTLVHKTEKGAIGGVIVETEAYTPDDPVSHTYRGQTLRNAAMFQPAGTLYVYFTYGMHYCMNIVAGSSSGEAVLIRALQPTIGIDLMQKNRKTNDIKKLCSGPAKLVQALGVTREHNGTHLNNGEIILAANNQQRTVTAGPRIGIRKATDTPWRFYDAVSPFLSR